LALRGALALVLLLGAFAPTSAAERPLTLPAFLSKDAVEPLDIEAGPTPQSITKGLLVYKEAPDARMQPGDLQRILSLPRRAWQSGAAPAARASNFTPTTLWMMGLVRNANEQPLERWLVLQTWRLSDVRFFAIDADTGDVIATYESGQRVPMAERVIETPEASFPLSLAPGQRALLLVRIQDKTFGAVLARLHDPQQRLRESRNAQLFQSVLFGFVLAVVLVLLFLGDWRYAVVAVWLGGTATYELIYLVPLLPTLFPALTPHIIPIFTIGGTLAIAAFALMTLSFLELYRSPFWLIFYGACIAFLIGCCLAILWIEQHHLVRKASGTVCLAVVYSWPFAAWAGRGIVRQPYGRALVILFAVYWVVELVRVMIVNGVVNLNLYADPLMLLYLFGLVSFALGVVGIDSRRKRDLSERLRRELHNREEAEQQRLLDRQREEAARLTAEVERKTQALRKAGEQAQASSEAKSRFLSSASHELRAPLHDLLGYAQLLTREVPAAAQAHLAVIQTSGKQLLSLIDDILDFSRGDAKPMVLERTPLSLHALAAHLQAACAPAAARGGNRLETRLDPGLADWVIADERRLTQVLRNLLDNACKYTRDGRIELAIERIDAAKQTDALPAADGLPTRFSVRDTGIGIPADQQQAIFEPFKRLDRYDRSPGLGLGLAISQQIVHAMGGYIQVQSPTEPRLTPAGSLFRFELRLQKADAAGAGRSAGRSAGMSTSRAILGYRGPPRTLLIVDDLVGSRRLLADRCEFLGFEVQEAGNGLEALAKLQASANRPDLALVDQFMPELDGWGFLRRLRASAVDRTMPVVLISAAPEQPPDGFPETVRFDEVALKPLSAEALTDILQRHLNLVWEYAESDSESGESAAIGDDSSAPWSLPSDCCDLQLAELKEMVSLGAVVAIERWAVEMTKTHPSQAAVWTEIRRRAASVDLARLRELVAQLPE
jgi:signal transduction histidine kinase/DNA-binding LytR/AlgR family response regulator